MPNPNWRKGISGNPKGRPKAAKGLRAELVRRYGEDGKPLVERLDKLSQHRNPKVALTATELLLAYLAGKPPQQVEHMGEGGGPVQIRFGGRYRPDGHVA
jgi:hypothetical protein